MRKVTTRRDGTTRLLPHAVSFSLLDRPFQLGCVCDRFWQNLFLNWGDAMQCFTKTPPLSIAAREAAKAVSLSFHLEERLSIPQTLLHLKYKHSARGRQLSSDSPTDAIEEKSIKRPFRFPFRRTKVSNCRISYSQRMGILKNGSLSWCKVVSDQMWYNAKIGIGFCNNLCRILCASRTPLVYFPFYYSFSESWSVDYYDEMSLVGNYKRLLRWRKAWLIHQKCLFHSEDSFPFRANLTSPFVVVHENLCMIHTWRELEEEKGWSDERVSPHSVRQWDDDDRDGGKDTRINHTDPQWWWWQRLQWTSLSWHRNAASYGGME